MSAIALPTSWLLQDIRTKSYSVACESKSNFTLSQNTTDAMLWQACEVLFFSNMTFQNVGWSS